MLPLYSVQRLECTLCQAWCRIATKCFLNFHQQFKTSKISWIPWISGCLICGDFLSTPKLLGTNVKEISHHGWLTLLGVVARFKARRSMWRSHPSLEVNGHWAWPFSEKAEFSMHSGHGQSPSIAVLGMTFGACPSRTCRIHSSAHADQFGLGLGSAETSNHVQTARKGPVSCACVCGDF